MIEAIAAALAGAAAHRRRTGRPYVTLSYAQSLDGSLTDRPGSRLRLSGPAALRLTHRLRAAHDAILVGVGTVLVDDPQLTVRLVSGPSPQPIVVDGRLRTPPTATLLEPERRPPWIATLAGAPAERRAPLAAAGARLLELPAAGDGRVDLAALLDRLAGLGIASLMVEGGARIITSFLAGGLVDQLVLTVAPVLVGGRRAVDDLSGHLPCPAALRQVSYHALDGDLIVRGDVERAPA